MSRIIHADAVAGLTSLESKSAHCCVTSPPYYKQRDYESEGQIGNEPTPWLFVTRLSEVFRHVHRVLRDDGTFWLNIGDTYINRQPAMIPYLLATVMRQDGWMLRQDVIWSKPSPMPESVRTRCAKSHEHVFMFSKSEKYYFDSLAVPEFRKDVWTIASKGYSGAHFAVMPERLAEACVRMGTSEAGCCPKCWAPFSRVVSRVRVPTRPGRSTKATRPSSVQGNRDPLRHVTVTSTLSWAPSCSCATHDESCDMDGYCRCAAGPRPCVVLDPFAGSGTTIAVSSRIGRVGVGIELNERYVELAKERIA